MLINTKSSAETKKFATRFAKYILGFLKSRASGSATIISLEGNLGAGKTTFVQGFAKALGIEEKISSPTFVVMKSYKIPPRLRKVRGSSPEHSETKNYKLKTINCVLYHIDCYRLEKPEELLGLGFKDILRDPAAIILIEWGDRVRRILPKNHTTLKFSHAGKNVRSIEMTGFSGILGTKSSLDSRLRGNDKKRRLR